MPLLTTVTFIDDDGDEFPIAFAGSYSPGTHENRWLEEHARERIAGFVADGSMRPRGELVLVQISDGEESRDFGPRKDGTR